MLKYFTLGLCVGLLTFIAPLSAAKTNEQIQIELNTNAAQWHNDMSTIKAILSQIEAKKGLVRGDFGSIVPLLETLSKLIDGLQVKLKDPTFQTADSDINSLKALMGQLDGIVKAIHSDDPVIATLLPSIVNAVAKMRMSIGGL